jgi:hypothetical protein
MSSVKSTTDKPEVRKNRFSLGLRELFGKKKEPWALPSNSSHADEGFKIVSKHARRPYITSDDEPNSALSGTADVGALPYGHASLHVADAQSQQSLVSHKSRASVASKRVAAQNEYVLTNPQSGQEEFADAL